MQVTSNDTVLFQDQHMIGDPVCLVRFYRSEFWFRKNLYSIEDWGPIWPTLYVYPGEWLEEA